MVKLLEGDESVQVHDSTAQLVEAEFSDLSFNQLGSAAGQFIHPAEGNIERAVREAGLPELEKPDLQKILSNRISNEIDRALVLPQTAGELASFAATVNNLVEHFELKVDGHTLLQQELAERANKERALAILDRHVDEGRSHSLFKNNSRDDKVQESITAAIEAGTLAEVSDRLSALVADKPVRDGLIEAYAEQLQKQFANAGQDPQSAKESLTQIAAQAVAVFLKNNQIPEERNDRHGLFGELEGNLDALGLSKRRTEKAIIDGAQAFSLETDLPYAEANFRLQALQKHFDIKDPEIQPSREQLEARYQQFSIALVAETLEGLESTQELSAEIGTFFNPKRQGLCKSLIESKGLPFPNKEQLQIVVKDELLQRGETALQTLEGRRDLFTAKQNIERSASYCGIESGDQELGDVLAGLHERVSTLRYGELKGVQLRAVAIVCGNEPKETRLAALQDCFDEFSAKLTLTREERGALAAKALLHSVKTELIFLGENDSQLALEKEVKFFSKAFSIPVDDAAMSEVNQILTSRSEGIAAEQKRVALEKISSITNENLRAGTKDGLIQHIADEHSIDAAEVQTAVIEAFSSRLALELKTGLNARQLAVKQEELNAFCSPTGLDLDDSDPRVIAIQELILSTPAIAETSRVISQPTAIEPPEIAIQELILSTPAIAETPRVISQPTAIEPPEFPPAEGPKPAPTLSLLDPEHDFETVQKLMSNYEPERYESRLSAASRIKDRLPPNYTEPYKFFVAKTALEITQRIQAGETHLQSRLDALRSASGISDLDDYIRRALQLQVREFLMNLSSD